MRKTRIAHWVEVGLCGQYRTVKDLVKAEREAGLDARIIDFHMLSKTEHKWESRRIEGSEDIEWAKEADVYIRHTFVPKEYRDLGKPIIMCCHGRPESTFRLSRSGQIKLHHEFENCFKNDLYKAFVSFWPEYIYINIFICFIISLYLSILCLLLYFKLNKVIDEEK